MNLNVRNATINKKKMQHYVTSLSFAICCHHILLLCFRGGVRRTEGVDYKL